MTYEFKKVEELLWAAAVAAVIVVGDAIVSTDFEMLTDWKTWLIGVAGGAARAAIAVVMSKLITRPPPAPP